MILAENLEEAIQLSNQFAPEHLEIQTQNPKEKLEEVKNAGTVLLGEKSVEALGDYTTGTNHVLPTGGAARYRGGLSVRDYVKTITWEKQTSQSIKQIGQQAINMAKIETLPAHKKSIQKRTQEEKQ